MDEFRLVYEFHVKETGATFGGKLRRKMDAELLREREAFKRKAQAVPTIENRIKKEKSSSSASSKGGESSRKDASSSSSSSLAAGLASGQQSAKARLDMMQLKQMGGSSTSMYKFGVLTKIVRHMKFRHMEGEDQPLTLDEILDETNQLDVSGQVKHWLVEEALRNNPKIEVRTREMAGSLEGQPQVAATAYIFRPPFNITSKKGLIKLLEQYDRKGLGGIVLEDLQESLPRCDKILSNLVDQDRILVISGAEKKKVVFLKESAEQLQILVDEEFQKLWRSVAVDGLDDRKVEEYLEKTGFATMQDQSDRNRAMMMRKPQAKRKVNRKKRGPKDNEHMVGVLEDYDEITAESNKVK